MTNPTPSQSDANAALGFINQASGQQVGTAASSSASRKIVPVPIGVTTYTPPSSYKDYARPKGLSEHTGENVADASGPTDYTDREHMAQAADLSLQQTGSSDSVKVETADADTVKAQILNPNLWPDDKLSALAGRMVDAGMLPAGTYDRHAIEVQWGNLVDFAAAKYAANPDSALTPEDMIDLYGSGDAKRLGATNAGGPTTTTVLNRNITLSTNDQARDVLQQLMHGAIGRKPTGKEVDDFQAALNQAQRSNVVTTSQATTSDPANHTVTQTDNTVNPGVDSGQFSNDYFDKNPELMKEYSHYQAATSLTNWAMQALAGPYGQ